MSVFINKMQYKASIARCSQLAVRHDSALDSNICTKH